MTILVSSLVTAHEISNNQVERFGHIAGRKYFRPPIRAEPVQTEESANRTVKINKKSERRKTTYRNGGPSEQYPAAFFICASEGFSSVFCYGF